MNGSVHSMPKEVEIQLKRGPAGLGFNIVGGLDQQYVLNDSGIYVAKIKENGAAALDGRLQEGDKILAINGNRLENLSHSAAVELFRSAGEDVFLCVQQRSSLHHNGPVSSRPESEAPVSSVGLLLGLAAAAAAITVAVVYFKRFPPGLRKPI